MRMGWCRRLLSWAMRPCPAAMEVEARPRWRRESCRGQGEGESVAQQGQREPYAQRAGRG
jgi:hypothetical protein